MRTAVCHYSLHRRYVEESWTPERLAEEVREFGAEGIDFHAGFLGDAATAAGRKADLLIAHEPTLWRHSDESRQLADDALKREKARFVEEAGLTILRIHYSWDHFPEVAVPFARARFYGLDGRPSGPAAPGK